MTIANARTKNPNGVPAGRPHPADNTPQSSDRGDRILSAANTAREFSPLVTTAADGITDEDIFSAITGSGSCGDN
jgi:hypothetical protein